MWLMLNDLGHLGECDGNKLFNNTPSEGSTSILLSEAVLEAGARLTGDPCGLLPSNPTLGTLCPGDSKSSSLSLLSLSLPASGDRVLQIETKHH